MRSTGVFFVGSIDNQKKQAIQHTIKLPAIRKAMTHMSRHYDEESIQSLLPFMANVWISGTLHTLQMRSVVLEASIKGRDK